MSSIEKKAVKQKSDTDISALVSLIYETVLAPSLSIGFTERDNTVNNSDQAGNPIGRALNTALIEQALPHLDHALELTTKQHSAGKSSPPTGILFDDLPLPVCIISRQLELLSINKKARTILKKNSRLPQPAEQALAIDDLLKRDILNAVAATIDTRHSRTLNYHIDSGITQTILVMPGPSYNRVGAADSEPSAEILFLNFESGINELTAALVDLYGLTQSEAQVTAYLAQGASLEDIAKRKACSLNTVRTQIKSAYAKTGTHRQGQLISLALNGPAVWLNIMKNNIKRWEESSSITSSSEKRLHLKDGRILGYGDYGPEHGKPVVLCHHLLGSRKEKPTDKDILKELGVRLIVPERPGVGFSCGAEERALSDWAEDVRQLTDHLNIKHFYIAGLSSGGPYAAACASLLDDRIIKLGLIASQMPIDELPSDIKVGYLQRFMTTMARHWPAPLQKILESRYSKLLGNPDSAIAEFKADGSEPDKGLLENFKINQFRRQNLVDASQLSTTIFAKELIVLSRPWGFKLSELKVPVMLWHGKQDDFFPVEHAEAIAELIPDCKASFNENWGHFFLYGEWKNILGALVH
ncbi:MAG: alpha/beta fold hydrolase [Pseudomonadales bacterium]|nr:alpha/beta fold hydrolase [Pseudomonadales bacterium]